MLTKIVISRRQKVVTIVLVLCTIATMFFLVRFAAFSSSYLSPLTKLSHVPSGLIVDSGSIHSLRQAVEQQLLYWNKPERVHDLPVHQDFTVERQRQTLEALHRELIRPGVRMSDIQRWIEASCDVYVTRGDGQGQSLLTGYYIPMIKGALKPSKGYRYPLYRKPQGLMSLPIKSFKDNLPDYTLKVWPQGDQLVPMYTREQIDQEGVLANKNLELVYLSSYLDQFFMHIQGSGIVLLPNGQKLMLNYDDKNGRKYRSVGGMLSRSGLMNRSQISMQSIRDFFQRYPSLQWQFLSQNESYIFFRNVDRQNFPLGDIEVPLTAERSLASDHRIFPKGSLVFVSTQALPYNKTSAIPYRRLMIDQDTGGVIRGTARFDLFFGIGPKAAWSAGQQKNPGTVYYLLLRKHPKPYSSHAG